MAKKPTTAGSWLQTAATSLTKVHFLYVAAFAASLIVFDSWNLYTHEAAGQLWTAAGALLAANTIFWYAARMKYRLEMPYRIIIMLLVLADILFASYNVLWQQGLASKSVALFAIPIATAAVLRSRSALFAAASLSAAAYSVVAIRYFFQNYGEGYRVELYGTIGFYCAVFFVLAGLLAVAIRLPSDSSKP